MLLTVLVLLLLVYSPSIMLYRIRIKKSYDYGCASGFLYGDHIWIGNYINAAEIVFSSLLPFVILLPCNIVILKTLVKINSKV